MEWTDKEIEYIKNNYPSKSNSIKQISIEIKKSEKAVMHKAARLGLERPNPPVNKPKDKSHRTNADKKYYEKNRERIYLRKKDRLRKHKLELLKKLGERCQICGYNRCSAALEFHHKDKNKDAAVTRHLKDYSKEKALKEAEKCIILCANCHRELHNKELINSGV